MRTTDADAATLGAWRDQRVDPVMLSAPKTLPAAAVVGDVRAALADDHVHLVLLTDDAGRLVGTLARGDLPDAAAPTSPALGHAVLAGRTVRVDATVGEALDRLAAADRRRLAVVDADGRLLGLLCLNRRRDGFCSDEGVAARRRERA